MKSEEAVRVREYSPVEWVAFQRGRPSPTALMQPFPSFPLFLSPFNEGPQRKFLKLKMLVCEFWSILDV